jgi:hypothetical protein
MFAGPINKLPSFLNPPPNIYYGVHKRPPPHGSLHCKSQIFSDSRIIIIYNVFYILRPSTARSCQWLLQSILATAKLCMHLSSLLYMLHDLPTHLLSDHLTISAEGIHQSVRYGTVSILLRHTPRRRRHASDPVHTLTKQSQAFVPLHDLFTGALTHSCSPCITATNSVKHNL